MSHSRWRCPGISFFFRRCAQMRTPEDNKNTTEWAITLLAGVAFVVSGQHFMLANRVTGRAHSLYFVGGGFTVGLELEVNRALDLDYTSFRTSRPVNFNDFVGKWARLSSITVTAGVGFSKTILTIWDG